jgi:drug/metabolite transporter, DME family
MPSEGLKKPIRLGYLYVAIAAVLWAISGAASKFLFNSGLSPFQLIQLRTTISLLGLFLWLILRHPALLQIAWKDLPYFFFLGTFGIAAAQFLYLFAISKINVAAAILLHYTGPVFVALYAVLFTQEKLHRVTVLAIFTTLIGCYLVVEAYHLDLLSMNRAGIAGGLLAAIAFAIYTISSEYGMRTYSSWTVLVFALFFAAGLWNILHPPLEAFLHAYSAVEWGWILFIAICGTIIPFGLYFKGIHLIRPTHASITATIEPITAAVFAYFFLGESMEPLQILGGIMVIASIILLQRR